MTRAQAKKNDRRRMTEGRHRPAVSGRSSQSPELPVKCSARDYLPLDELMPLQGGLKTLSDESAGRLRASIIKYGITFPFFVWKKGPKNYLLDGTQRDRILGRLREEGFKIPPLPVSFIEAKNEKEAREKILLLSSQYGHMTEESLKEFLDVSNIDLGEVTGTIDLPQIDIEALSIAMKTNGQAEEENPTTHEVVITCKSKREQRGVIASLVKQGYQCRARSV